MQVLEYEGIMHRGTHMDAPIHVLENTPFITEYETWRFFGTGVAVSIPKGKWGVITPEDLEKARPKIQPGDIVMINTGSHHNWGDNPDYFAYSPGLYKAAAEWLVAKKVKLVGVDVQALDHPLGTFLGPHGPGPAQPHLDDEYFALNGRHIIDDFPYWEPSHKVLMTQRHPRHRERQRRSRQGHRQALHLHVLPVALARGRGLRHPHRRGDRSGAEIPFRARVRAPCKSPS